MNGVKTLKLYNIKQNYIMYKQLKEIKKLKHINNMKHMYKTGLVVRT